MPYQYARNNPVNLIDWLGFEDLWLAIFYNEEVYDESEAPSDTEEGIAAWKAELHELRKPETIQAALQAELPEDVVHVQGFPGTKEGVADMIKWLSGEGVKAIVAHGFDNVEFISDVSYTWEKPHGIPFSKIETLGEIFMGVCFFADKRAAKPNGYGKLIAPLEKGPISAYTEAINHLKSRSDTMKKPISAENGALGNK